MLTRLKVTGFKNLVDVDVRFGPFTCIAGGNGVGKSNLLDAIRFLSALVDQPLVDAALSVRDDGGRSGDLRSLFHHVGNEYDTRMSFEAEMIVPAKGLDDLGQLAEASITFLRYKLTLGYRADEASGFLGALELVEETLEHIQKGDAKKHLPFPHSKQWRDSVIQGKRYVPLISTEDESGSRVVKIHQDQGGGRPRKLLAAKLPRTALSSASATESPTATLAKVEMRSWRLLQLEPSALRQPDPFTARAGLAMNGAHLPATLHHMSHRNGAGEPDGNGSQVLARVANRLSELVEDVRSVSIDQDEKRQLYTLLVTGADGTTHPARALSDGTLRFLALAVLELDPENKGLLCLEEPENGIHPERIPAMLDLLQSTVTDPQEPVDDDNPLRQVIVNTHSPAVVAQVPDDCLLFAELREAVRDGKRFKRLGLACLDGTWRAEIKDTRLVPKGQVLRFLSPVSPHPAAALEAEPQRRSPRVIDRSDLQPYLDFSGSGNE